MTINVIRNHGHLTALMSVDLEAGNACQTLQWRGVHVSETNFNPGWHGLETEAGVHAYFDHEFPVTPPFGEVWDGTMETRLATLARCAEGLYLAMLLPEQVAA